MSFDEETNTWVEPTIVPRKVRPGDPPGEPYRPAFFVAPCLNVACLNVCSYTPGTPGPERCPRCGSPTVLARRPR
ncbi:MAG TPA: hypothetical protein VKD66_03320 [Streptosporangiaceae bacterium]|nr:hypothetical protein [Streptosporangiaceae bacterium]